MNQSDTEQLKENVGRLVRVCCRDGEVFVGRVLSVSELENDLVYDLVTTSREAQYEKADKQPAYLIRFDEIASIEPLPADE
jgi:small nuclear ribonucleoprotein (snRNP)-like protein